MSKWPLAPLGEVLIHRKEFIQIDDLESYKRCRVQLHANGIVLRDQVPGAEIKTKKQQICKTGEFLVAEIDAKLGGYGLVPPELDGAIVSSHYFLFEINESKLDRRFLGYFIRTPAFHEQVASQGSTNYAAIRPGHVLQYTIPLPSLDQQRRSVDQIDALAVKIDAAKRLRKQSNAELSVLVGQAVRHEFENGATANWERASLGDYVTNCSYGTSDKTSDDNSGTPILRMGNIQDGQLDLTDLKYLHLSPDELDKLRLLKGDILVNRTNSAELVGKSAVFDSPGDYGCASYIIRLRIDQQRANPRLIAHYINSPVGRAYMFNEKKQMTGQANVNSQTLRALPICLPALDEQNKMLQRIEALRQHRNRLSALQSERDQELNALLPAILDRAFQGTPL